MEYFSLIFLHHRHHPSQVTYQVLREDTYLLVFVIYVLGFYCSVHLTKIMMQYC